MTDRTHPDSGRIITSSDILLHDAETALMYEELRAAIDDGHESMTHSDALAEIAAIRAENTELRAQLEAIGAGGVQALSAAPVEVADAMADSHYLAGVSAGWNAANADDPNEALRKLHESRAGYLKPICTAARAPADSVLEDAARLDWLALAGPTSICVVSDRPHDGEVEVATDDVTGYGKTLREAIDDARKQGANHD